MFKQASNMISKFMNRGKVAPAPIVNQPEPTPIQQPTQPEYLETRPTRSRTKKVDTGRYDYDEAVNDLRFNTVGFSKDEWEKEGRENRKKMLANFQNKKVQKFIQGRLDRA